MSMSDISFNRKFSVAPMLDWTDRHCRYFLRLMSKHTSFIYGNGYNEGRSFTVKATI